MQVFCVAQFHRALVHVFHDRSQDGVDLFPSMSTQHLLYTYVVVRTCMGLNAVHVQHEMYDRLSMHADSDNR
jgi:hypothetical protein